MENVFQKKCIVFGAGDFGRRALNLIGRECFSFICDNDQDKVGGDIDGISIISFCDLKKLYNNEPVLICVAPPYDDEIANQLEKSGITCFLPYTELLAVMKHVDNCYLQKYCKPVIYKCFDLLDVGCAYIDVFFDSFKDVLSFSTSQKLEKCEKIKIVSRLDSIEPDTDVVVVADKKYHMASYEQLRKNKKKTGYYYEILDPFTRKAFGDEQVLIRNGYQNTKDTLEGEWNDRTRELSIQYQDIAKRYINEVCEDVPIFRLIEIETINRCNGGCSFCPVNSRSDPREFKKMEETLFYSIIDQLSELNYNGRISLFSNNEPLLDDRIITFHKYAREHLPYAVMHLFTNGTLLTCELLDRLLLYLDELVIDNYNQELKLIPSVKKIVDYCEEKPEYTKKVTVYMRKPVEILTTRGGNANNREEIPDYSEIVCAHPYQQMVVRPSGQVSLCCNDPLGKVTMGDLTKQSLLDVWYGPEYTEIRKKISLGRGNFENCKKCDVFCFYE